MGLRGVTTALSLGVVIALGSGKTLAQQDRGQPVAPDKALKLGPDVTRTVGLPAGPPVTGAELHRRTEELTSRMRCPVCQGHAIVDSPAEAARNMKSQVRAMIAAGFSEDQILRYFEAAYGEFIRLMPRASGFNLLVWLIPIVGAALGLIGILVVFRRRSVAKKPGTGTREAARRSEDTGQGAEQSTEDDDGLGDWLAKVREEVGSRDE
jgi:cytochrome c-type biogenesis protein CcmH